MSFTGSFGSPESAPTSSLSRSSSRIKQLKQWPSMHIVSRVKRTVSGQEDLTTLGLSDTQPVRFVKKVRNFRILKLSPI
ncbi:hypothetical protein L596_012590 [Steinernema carpocapsae]|uniref:Uncharacterized protein n=1 Tax=Steinernema carpocapsae TaxID=34508 RepID=A0A4U5NYE8_STECR|nr:hypothetical protein L596_012590 [Steinernema carpocapsae]